MERPFETCCGIGSKAPITGQITWQINTRATQEEEALLVTDNLREP
ncbi:MAG: hypothetical protein ACOYNR_12615 [Blastocatellia bacterium]